MPSTPSSDAQGRARRALCDELARLLAQGNDLRTVRLLQLLGIVEAPRQRPGIESEKNPTERRTDPQPISIWQPVKVDGELLFERPPPLPLGDHHATRRQMPAVKAPAVRRICLFGESAAAGYLYAPHLTPAMVMQRQLEEQESGALEIIDLARTNERLESMVRTAERALQLDPDQFVVYTGNNWKLLEAPECSPYAPSVQARQEFAAAWRQGGAAGVVRWAERRWRRKALAAFDRLAQIATGAGVGVTLIVPEVNLRDWENRQPPPWLPGDGSRRWHKLYEQAVGELDADRPRAALSLAREMLALDDGLCPTAHRLAVRAHLALGEGDEARRAAGAEVAALAYPTLAFLGAPQACTAVQDFQRQAAESHGWSVVDLPEVFADYLEEQGLPPLPGRELFLDYCHLSGLGMELAMALPSLSPQRRSGKRSAPGIPGGGAIVAERGGRMGGVGRGSEGVATAGDSRRAEAEKGGAAVARIGAALHTAHRLTSTQPSARLLEHWLRRALEQAPTVADTLVDLAEARTAPAFGRATPAVLTVAQERNLASRHRLLLQHGWRWDSLDAEVLLAILKVLREAGEGKRAGAIEARLVAHHRPTSKNGLDLLSPLYLWNPLERFFPEVMETADLPERGTLRCPWPEVSFCRVAAAGEAQRLTLTARLPPIPGDGGERPPAALTVWVHQEGEEGDGEAVALLDLKGGWTRHSVRLPPASRSGLSRLTLRWPPLPAHHGMGDAALEAILRRLEEGLEADLHPIFGELARLRLHNR